MYVYMLHRVLQCPKTNTEDRTVWMRTKRCLMSPTQCEPNTAAVQQRALNAFRLHSAQKLGFSYHTPTARPPLQLQVMCFLKMFLFGVRNSDCFFSWKRCWYPQNDKYHVYIHVAHPTPNPSAIASDKKMCCWPGAERSAVWTAPDYLQWMQSQIRGTIERVQIIFMKSLDIFIFVT